MKKDERDDNPTAVTKISKNRRTSEQPTMSFTAVVSHQTMAEAFVNEMLRFAQSLIPDHDITAEEVLTIFQRALSDQTNRSITMVNGRHLRSRISEQVSRAKRYNEPFSLLVLNLNMIDALEDYDAIVDTLRERMRQTDMIFLFKHRIVLILPHTNATPCRILLERIQNLLKEGLLNLPEIPITALTFPNDTMGKSMEVLDWAENQLRG